MKTQTFVPSVVILNYHRVSDSLNNESLFSIHPNLLREHFQILKDHQVNVCNTELHGSGMPEKPFTVSLSFDDGNLSDFDVVLPLLEAFGFKASFFPIVNHIGSAGKLNWDHLRNISAQGFGIGSHGLSHEIMMKLTGEQQIDELRESKKRIEDGLGKKITQFAFPFGRHDDDLLIRCKGEGFVQALTTGLKINKLMPDSFLLYRWNITNKTSTDLLRQVISSSGKLSPSIELTNKLNGITKNKSDQSQN